VPACSAIALTGPLDEIDSSAQRADWASDVETRAAHDVAASIVLVTLHSSAYEVGVRELHDRLSEHLGHVERGAEVLVTRRGRPVARLSAIDGEDPLEDLVRRGLITPPARARSSRRARAKARGSVSDLVAEQRR